MKVVLTYMMAYKQAPKNSYTCLFKNDYTIILNRFFYDYTI